MKTNKQTKRSTKNNQPSTKSGLPNRAEQFTPDKAESSETETQTASAKAPETASDQTTNNQPPTINTSIRPYVNFAEREAYRQLPVEKVLEKLKRWMPRQYELAEVVGKWVWITFPEQPIERVRADLSLLGFHWNNTRKCWQHPCGEALPRGTQEPREKYEVWFPKAAEALRRKKVQAQKSEVYFDPAQQTAATAATTA